MYIVCVKNILTFELNTTEEMDDILFDPDFKVIDIITKKRSWLLIGYYR